MAITSFQSNREAHLNFTPHGLRTRWFEADFRVLLLWILAKSNGVRQAKVSAGKARGKRRFKM